MKVKRNRLLAERALPELEAPKRPLPGRRARGKAVRSVTVNLAESPLGWLKARGHVSGRQFDAGERLREDWERAQLAGGDNALGCGAVPLLRPRGARRG